jgi:ATPase subunit of ABC transporter with duplicated ATPase domains
MSELLVRLNDVSRHFEETKLFSNLHALIHRGDKIGLIGPNGSGKSTLLDLIIGTTKPSSGLIEISGTIATVSQLGHLVIKDNPEATIADYLQTQITDEYWKVISLLETQFGYTPPDFEQCLTDLSGGETTKLLISIALSKNPDLLILDEPTNHLDHFSQEQLYKALESFEGALLVASHDPDFLNACVNTIWELEKKALRIYGGNFDFYQNQKKIELAAYHDNYQAAQQKLKHTSERKKEEVERTNKANSKIAKNKFDQSLDKYDKHARSQSSERTTQIRRKIIEKQTNEAISEIQKYSEEYRRPLHVVSELAPSKRTLWRIINGQLLINDRPLLKIPSFEIHSGERVHIKGNNGSGKTTFINGLLQNTDGIEIIGENIFGAENVVATYLDQKYSVIDQNKNLIANLKNANPDLDETDVRTRLGHMNFYGDKVYTLAKELSGGEQARLALAIAIANKTEVLILDEPTNNLDLQSVSALTKALQEFPGALLIISHNYAFVRELKPDRSYNIQGQALKIELS